MKTPRFNSSRTQEVPARKIALTKVEEVSREPKKGSVIGWEYASPEKGCPYVVYLYSGAVLITSPIQEVREIPKGVIIETLNSMYQVEYMIMECLKEKASGQFPALPGLTASSHTSRELPVLS